MKTQYRLGRLWACAILLASTFVPFVALAETDWVSKAVEARKAKDYAATIRFLKKAIEEESSPVLLNNLGKTYELIGRYDLAFQTYQIVVDDPNTGDKLRQLDIARMNKIKPNLSKTLVLVPAEGPWQQVWVNGEAHPMGNGIELPSQPGDITIDMFDEKRKLLIRTIREGKAGQRLVVEASQAQGLDKNGATVSWKAAKRKLKSLSIDDVSVPAPMRKIKHLRIAPGAYSIAAHWVGREPETVDVDLVGRQVFELVPRATPAPILPTAAAVNQPVTSPTHTPTTLTSAPPSPVANRMNWTAAGQITSALVGLGVGAFGYAQYSDGMSERDRIRAEQNDDTLGTARDFRNWNAGNSSATDQVNQGLWITSMGGVMVVATTVWWLLSDTPPSSTSMQVKQGRSTLVGGSF